MVFNLKPSSAPPSPPAPAFGLDDVPPAYNSLAPSTSAGPSSSTSTTSNTVVPGPSGHGGAVDQPLPSRFAHLFVPPPGAEPQLGRVSSTARAVLKRIATFKSKENYGTMPGTTSWDPQLNDPNALYDWIRAQATLPPKITLHCKGTHPVIAEHTHTTTINGVVKHVHRGQTYHVTDFDFFIDLSPTCNHAITMANVFVRTVQPWEPARRRTWANCYGSLFAPAHTEMGIGERGVTTAGRLVTSTENKRWNDWHTRCSGKGVPGWSRVDESGVPAPIPTDLEAGDEERLLGNTGEWDQAALKEWCQAYCADTGLLKSFWVRRGMWGWDIEGVKAAVKAAIESTGYPGKDITVSYAFDEAYIKVVPNNWLSRAIHTPWIFALLCISFIYPLIWIWSHLHFAAGAPYDVTRISHAFKFYPALPDTSPIETLESAQSRLPGLFKLHPEIPKEPFLQRGPKGIHYLLGKREGEWFREWEERIRMAVRMRFSGELEATVVSHTPRPDLDGY